MDKPWSRLDQLLQPRKVPVAVWVIGVFCGCLWPIEILLFSWLLQLLQTARGGPTGYFSLGEFIRIPLPLFSELPPLTMVALVVMSIFLAAAAQAIFSWFLGRLAHSFALERFQQLMLAIFQTSTELAVTKSISGQQTSLRNSIQKQSPTAKKGWEIWHREVPQNIVQGLLCCLIALSIHPLVTLLAFVCILLLMQLYRILDLRFRTSLPVLQERVSSLRQRIQELCETGPLLEIVHLDSTSSEAMQSQIRALNDIEGELSSAQSWKLPIMTLTTALFVVFVSFIMAIRIVSPESAIDVSSFLVFFISILGVAWSTYRVRTVWRFLNDGTEDVQALVALIAQRASASPAPTNHVAPITNAGIVLDHVTIRDSEGKKLLEDIHLQFEPGKLVAVVGSDRLQPKALTELILGFGRPSSGRILLGGVDTIDVDPTSLKKTNLWIGPDGPLVAGTIEDNLQNSRRISLVELNDAVRAAGVYEAIQELSDGMSTLVSPHDDRLKPDYLFRLGIARALARKPSIVVAEEPAVRVAAPLELETYEALRQLTQREMFVLVLPTRLTTLRHADQIIVLHEHRVAALGNHAQLLETSELYRHLNYVRFSPLRHILA